MSSPQLENGHTRIANELLEAIIRFDFSKREYQVLLAIIRKTYGYKKTADDIGNSQIAEMTGLQRTHVAATIRGLEQKNVLNRKKGIFGHVIGVNKNYHTWGVTETVTGCVTETVTGCDRNSHRGVTETVTGGVTKTVTTKENLPKENPKRNITPPPQSYSSDVGCNENQNRGGGGKQILGTAEGAQSETGERGARGTEKIVRVQVSNLIFPKELTAQEREAAQNMLKSCGNSSQDILDALTAAMVAGQVKKSPVAFLGGLVRRYEAGTFDPAPAMHIKLAREKTQGAMTRQKSAEILSRVRALQEFEAFEAKRKARQKQGGA